MTVYLNIMKKLHLILPCLLGLFLAGCAVPYGPGPYAGPYYNPAPGYYDGTPYYICGGVNYYYVSGQYFYYRGPDRFYVTYLPHGGYYNPNHPLYHNHYNSGHSQQQYRSVQHTQYNSQSQTHTNVVQGQKVNQNGKPPTKNQYKNQYNKNEKEKKDQQ